MPLNDSTGRFERIVDSAMSHLEKIQDKVLPSVANRPLDSEPMSRQEMLTDYGTVQHDPTLLNERLKEFQGQHGQVKGLDIWMSWVEDMEKGDA